jgi:hypothetical protein
MKLVGIRSLRRFATMARERAEEYRAPYLGNPREDGEAAFAQSGSYPIYATLLELNFLLSKLADEIDAGELEE